MAGENLVTFKKMWSIRDMFYVKRHKEHLEFLKRTENLINIRFRLGTKLIDIKDKVARKRYSEQLHLIELKFGQQLKNIEKQIEGNLNGN